MKLETVSQSIYMTIFFLEKFQRKKTNYQTQDVEYTTGWPKSPNSC